MTLKNLLHSFNQYLSNTDTGRYCLDEEDRPSPCCLLPSFLLLMLLRETDNKQAINKQEIYQEVITAMQ